MREQRLVDANKLEYCMEYLRPELEECRNSVQRCVEVFAQSVGNQPTIDPKSLPIVQELRMELESVKAERDAVINELKRMVKEYEHKSVINVREDVRGSGS